MLDACSILGITKSLSQVSLEEAYNKKLIRIRAYKHIIDPIDYRILENQIERAYRFLVQALQDHKHSYKNILSRYLGGIWRKPSFILPPLLPEEVTSVDTCVETTSIKGLDRKTLTTRQSFRKLHDKNSTVVKDFYVDGKRVDRSTYDDAVKHQREEFGKSFEDLFSQHVIDVPSERLPSLS